MTLTFPGESAEYRAARDRLLASEIELRRAMETRRRARRRRLPPGGAVPQDYGFEGVGANGAPRPVRLSDLFAPGRHSLVTYNMMFPRDPGDDRPGPRREVQAPAALGQSLSLLHRAARPARRRRRARLPAPEPAVVAKAPLPRLLAFAADRAGTPAPGVVGRQLLQPRLPRRGGGRGHSGRCSTSSNGAATGPSATPGARRCSSRRPIPARSPSRRHARAAVEPLRLHPRGSPRRLERAAQLLTP